MWDNVTEIKCNIFGQVWLLHNLFFYVSVNTIYECCYLFLGWEIGHSVTSYTAGGIEGGHPKCLQVRTAGREMKNWSQDTYVLNGWPQINFVEYFFYIGLANYTRPSPPPRKMSLISSIIITIILSYAIIRI